MTNQTVDDLTKPDNAAAAAGAATDMAGTGADKKKDAHDRDTAATATATAHQMGKGASEVALSNPSAVTSPASASSTGEPPQGNLSHGQADVPCTVFICIATAESADHHCRFILTLHLLL